MHTAAAFLQAMEDVSRASNQTPAEQESCHSCCRVRQSQCSIRTSASLAEQNAEDMDDVPVVLDGTATYHTYKANF